MARGPQTVSMNPFGLARRAFGRLLGRDVMLYTGGVSFYAMLAGAPALAILVSVYSLLSTPDIAARHVQALSQAADSGEGAPRLCDRPQ